MWKTKIKGCIRKHTRGKVEKKSTFFISVRVQYIVYNAQPAVLTGRKPVVWKITHTSRCNLLQMPCGNTIKRYLTSIKFEMADFFCTAKLSKECHHSEVLQRKGNNVLELAVIRRAKLLAWRCPWIYHRKNNFRNDMLFHFWGVTVARRINEKVRYCRKHQ